MTDRMPRERINQLRDMDLSPLGPVLSRATYREMLDQIEWAHAMVDASKIMRDEAIDRGNRMWHDNERLRADLRAAHQLGPVTWTTLNEGAGYAVRCRACSFRLFVPRDVRRGGYTAVELERIFEKSGHADTVVGGSA